VAMTSHVASTSDACMVCGGRGDGAHFGAREACRACAAFFRRTVSMGKTYECRGDHQCAVEASIRCICRSCRYDRCLEVGMQPQNVQKRRDQVGPRLGSLSTDIDQPDSTAAVFISEDAGMPSLRRIHTHHMQLRAVRRVVHHGGVLHIPVGVQLHDVDGINLREVGIVADFCLGAFNELQSMEPRLRKRLYQLFFPSFIILECGWRTSNTATPERIVMANGDYIDTADISQFYKSGEKPEKKVDSKTAIDIYTPSYTFFREHVTQTMTRMGLDEYEMYALAALLFWDYDHEKMPTEVRPIAETVRMEILKELTFYYRFVKRWPDEVLRLPQLLLMLPALQRMTKRFVEDIEMGKVFNIYSIDAITYDIINLRG
ncbi:nhr-28, partial [Pristionchus pacificus]